MCECAADSGKKELILEVGKKYFEDIKEYLEE